MESVADITVALSFDPPGLTGPVLPCYCVLAGVEEVTLEFWCPETCALRPRESNEVKSGVRWPSVF